jgi:hypothetical protein
MTKGNPAVHAPGGLKPPVIVGKPALYLAVVVDPFFYRPIPGYFSFYF